MKPQSHMIERPAAIEAGAAKPSPAKPQLRAHWEVRNGQLTRSFDLSAA